MEKRRILILFAHPALQKSRVNRKLVERVRTLPGIHVHDLYDAYPEFDINVAHEQSLLEANDVIVFQHPLFWYSTPAIIKEWLDLVLEHNWAYGSKGKALHGKYVMHAVTTGGREVAYSDQGLNRYSIREFLRPLEQTAYLCGMDFLPPFIVHGTHLMPPEAISQHADEYYQVIQTLQRGQIDVLSVKPDLPRINANLDDLLSSSEGG